jgi:hypothetical protein
MQRLGSHPACCGTGSHTLATSLQRQPHQLPSRGARPAAARPARRTCTARATSATLPSTPTTVLFDLDSCVGGLDAVITSCAFHAARQQWPGAIVGHPDIYLPTMRKLITSTEAPEEAALLIRLLADEGIIGE